MEPEDKVNKQDEEFQEDTMTDKPKLLPFMTISTPSPDHRFLSESLKTEINLLSIFQKHKISLCVHKEIYDWAYEASILSAFKWGVGYNPYKERGNITKLMNEDLLPHMTYDRYKQKLIEWLPDLSPEQITVHNFENVVRSFLSNKDLVKQTNLSFPNANTPYSCKR